MTSASLWLALVAGGLATLDPGGTYARLTELGRAPPPTCAEDVRA